MIITFGLVRSVLGPMELGLILVTALVVLAPISLGRMVAGSIPTEQRATTGWLTLLVGVAIALYGLSRVDSPIARMASAMGMTDYTGYMIIGLGLLLIVVGLIVLTSKTTATGKTSPAPSAVTMKKCPECAETIQAEARKCRFCGSTLPEPSR